MQLNNADSIPKNISICKGDWGHGKLVNGVQLPLKGENFESYSNIGSFLGRTYVHTTVNKIMIDSYHQLFLVKPENVYKYAETGFSTGGVFKPHKSHQNGLSVDFMVPVIDSYSNSVHLPTTVNNKFGYDIDFDNQARFKHYKIDFESMASHLVELHKQALIHNSEIRIVIFDPKLQPMLFETKYSDYLKANIHFSRNPSWVRHDEHYHVDFKVNCEKL
jgi:penicillin-insensitive murein endopeptidase